MLKGFFTRDEDEDASTARAKQIVIEGQEEEAEEALSLLSEGGDGLDQTMEEIDTAVKEAAKASLRDIRLMEEGRCPSCGHKTRQFLFTSVCANCGWFSFISPEEGKSIIHLKNADTIECGTTFDTRGDYILGITDGVVRAKVSKRTSSTSNSPGPKTKSPKSGQPGPGSRPAPAAGAKNSSRKPKASRLSSTPHSETTRNATSSVQKNARKRSKSSIPFAYTRTATTVPASAVTSVSRNTAEKTKPFSSASKTPQSEKLF